MTSKELRRLSRADLLEMLINQSSEIEELKEKLSAAEKALEEQDIAIDSAGSIAEASLQVSGVFEAAQKAGQCYLENIKRLSERQIFVCERLEKESRDAAEARIAETEKRCSEMEESSKQRCAEMLTKAKTDSQAYWQELSTRMDRYYEEHVGLRELLSIVIEKPEVIGE